MLEEERKRIRLQQESMMNPTSLTAGSDAGASQTPASFTEQSIVARYGNLPPAITSIPSGDVASLPPATAGMSIGGKGKQS
jgi:hypothetical protein